MLDSGFIRFRCDSSPEALGWPVTSAWFARLAPADVEAAVQSLRALPELRLGLCLTGEDTLFFSIFHRSLDGVSEMRRRLGRLLPRLEVSRSLVLLRSHKRSGWLIDQSGRRTGVFVRPTVLSAEFLDA